MPLCANVDIETKQSACRPPCLESVSFGVRKIGLILAAYVGGFHLDLPRYNNRILYLGKFECNLPRFILIG